MMNNFFASYWHQTTLANQQGYGCFVCQIPADKKPDEMLKIIIEVAKQNTPTASTVMPLNVCLLPQTASPIINE